ncbi:sigma-70 family RNA polymerase sigma factor [Paenibacillus sp. PL2-23]|uniref:sigma-70 family RNA polymerase sigma factor n=1 Tax=Paenibacillus sp. PL2-23 TaxID=2100729 RepID=UPI0030F8622D
MNETAEELQLFESVKPALTSYCYRMLGSIDDADDAVQETYIRVWQSWSTFRQEASFNTWVYRIASNICLDKLRQAKRRIRPVDYGGPASTIVEPRDMLPDAYWIWPAPDLPETPEDIMVRRDTLQICFLALLQTLPPRQRAVLILKDVFEWPSKQIAETLNMSPAAVNSALQRARVTLEREKLRSDVRVTSKAEPDQELLSKYVEAFEQFDVETLVALFHEEGRMSMPPFTMWVCGKEHLSAFFTLTRSHCEGSRFVPITANGGYPALAQYVPSQEGDALIPWAIHLLELRNGEIYHVQHFIGAHLFAQFRLPLQLHR